MGNIAKVASVGQDSKYFETACLTLYIPLDGGVDFHSAGDMKRGVHMSRGLYGGDEDGLWASEVLVVV